MSRKKSISSYFGGGDYEQIINSSVQEKCDAAKEYFTNLEWTTATLGIIAGAGLSLVGVAGILTEGMLGLIMNAFLAVFGLTIMMLEFKDQFTITTYQNFLQRELHIIYTPYGRSGLYLLTGSIMLSKGGFFCFLLGIYVIGVGGFSFWVARTASEALATLLDAQYTEKDIKKKYDTFDSDKNGSLDRKEVKSLFDSFSLSLTDGQIEAAIFEIDSSGDGSISKDELINWWKYKKESAVSGVAAGAFDVFSFFKQSGSENSSMV